MVGTDGRGPALEIAEALAPQIAAAADEIDSERKLPTPLAEVMGDVGLFRLLVPKTYDGLEVELPDYLDAVQRIGQTDASTAWCVNQGCVWTALAVLLPDETSREIWGNPRAAIANGTPVESRTKAVEGGYELTGHWRFSSGCDHATWMGGAARIDDGTADGGGVGMFVFPKEDVEIVEAWDVTGMRGTGSHDFRASRLFVPEGRHTRSQAEPREPGPLYAIPMNLKFAVGFAAVALGVARSALDFAIDLSSGKTALYSTKLLRDDPVVQELVGWAETRWRVANQFLHTTVGEAWASVGAAGETSAEQKVRMRMAGTHTIREADAVMDLAYKIVGTDGIYRDRDFQRRYQDMKVITQHMQGRLTHYPRLGQYVLGLLDGDSVG